MLDLSMLPQDNALPSLHDCGPWRRKIQTVSSLTGLTPAHSTPGADAVPLEEPGFKCCAFSRPHSPRLAVPSTFAVDGGRSYQGPEEATGHDWQTQRSYCADACKRNKILIPPVCGIGHSSLR